MTPDAPVREWKVGPPPNEQIVEVESNGAVIRAMAFYGRDGTRPHWRSEDGNTHWDPSTFNRWRPVGASDV